MSEWSRLHWQHLLLLLLLPTWIWGGPVWVRHCGVWHWSLHEPGDLCRVERQLLLHVSRGFHWKRVPDWCGRMSVQPLWEGNLHKLGKITIHRGELAEININMISITRITRGKIVRLCKAVLLIFVNFVLLKNPRLHVMGNKEIMHSNTKIAWIVHYLLKLQKI